jgi:hypothetical protein
MNEVLYLSEATAARRRVKLSLAVDATDGITPETGLTGTGFYSANGAAGVATSASVVELDAGDLPGQYYIELTGTELTTMGVGNHMLYFKNAAALACVAHFSILPDDLWTASSSAADIADAVRTELTAELANIDVATSTRSSHAAADIWAVATRKLTALEAAQLSTDAVTEITDAIKAIVLETGVTWHQALAIIAAVAAGNLSGGGTGTEVIKGINVATTRISAATDASGNRTITLTLP